LSDIFQQRDDSRTSENVAALPCESVTPMDVARNVAGGIFSLGYTLSVAVSLARMNRSWVNRPDWMEKGQVFGLRCGESFAKLDLGSWLWRTSQLCLDGTLGEFSQTWPRSGMTRNGMCFPLVPSALLTDENEFSLWATPSARDWKDSPGMSTTGRGGANPPRSIAETSVRSGAKANVADAESLSIGTGLCAGESPEIRRRRSGDGGSAGNPWAVEPNMGRVAHGIPARVDRLKGLGNAVVPQIAEWIGRRIVACHEQAENEDL